jgi:hypothetical protein
LKQQNKSFHKKQTFSENGISIMGNAEEEFEVG